MKQKGLTMMELVVVVILLIVLAVIAIYASNRPNREAEAAVLFTEMKAVQEGILKIRTEIGLGDTGEDYQAGIHYNEVYQEGGSEVPGWYIIYGISDPQYNKTVLQNLGVQDLKHNYKVNFDTAEVELLDGPIAIGEYKIRTYQEMKNLMESGVI